jgi:hypothetical protein
VIVEERSLLAFNGVRFGDNKTFRKNISLPFSESKSKPRKKQKKIEGKKLTGVSEESIIIFKIERINYTCRLFLVSFLWLTLPVRTKRWSVYELHGYTLHTQCREIFRSKMIEMINVHGIGKAVQGTGLGLYKDKILEFDLKD